MILPANTGIPNDDSFTAGIRACGSELAKSLMDCIFDSGSTQEPTALNCGRQVKQCGPGSIECPNFCTCVSQNSAECGTISDRTQGASVTVCTPPSGISPGTQTGGVQGACDLPCCSWVAAGLDDKCSGVDCTSCRTSASGDEGLCQSDISSDVFHRLGCGFTDPIERFARALQSGTPGDRHAGGFASRLGQPAPSARVSS